MEYEQTQQGEGADSKGEGSWLERGKEPTPPVLQRAVQERAAGGAMSCSARANIVQRTLREWVILLITAVIFLQRYKNFCLIAR